MEIEVKVGESFQEAFTRAMKLSRKHREMVFFEGNDETIVVMVIPRTTEALKNKTM